MTNRTGKAALLILLDADRRILLQHRDDDAPACPGQWGLFGGAVEPNEAVRRAMVREAMEELRYDAGGAFRSRSFMKASTIRARKSSATTTWTTAMPTRSSSYLRARRARWQR